MRRMIVAATLAAVLPLLALGQATDTVKRNQEIIRRHYELLNRGDFKVAVVDFEENMKHQGRPVTRASRLRVLEDLYTTFPDWQMKIEDMVAEGDSVVVRSSVSGTHRGVQKLAVNGNLLMGAEPTLKRFEAQHIHWYKFRDGKIVEHHATRDDIGMMRQLGLLPPVGLPEGSLAQTAGPEALDAFVRAWNTHDMKAFGRLFAEDADWVSVAGIWVKGRARIQAEHEEVHATVFKTSTLASTGTEVRLLGPDVAVIHFNWELTGQLDREGKPRGLRRGIITMVAVKQADGWRISAGQNTNALPETVAQAQVNSPDTHDHRRFQCLEDGLKSNKVGCLLLAKKEVARFPEGALFWHLNKFPTREAAEAAKGQTGMVVEAESQFWLFSFGPKGTAPKQGKHVASVGPLQLTSDKLPPAKSYEIVAYLAVMPPNQYTGVHTHPGPEAWYVLAGKQCLETPAGVMKARAGEGMFAPPTTPMRLTNNGSSIRRALFLVIHDDAQPWNIATEEWNPAGACDR